ADEAPQHPSIFRVRGAGKIEEQREADGELGLWRRALMNVPHRVHQFRGGIFFRIGREMPDIFVDRPRDHVEIEALRLARALIHVEPEALRARMSEPLLDGESVAARLGDLLALLVEKQLVDETFRLLRAEDAADMAGK